ncbi:MAG: MFS transporter [Alphaproteobacteria bacterium]|nr:MFS transporter [Alphaproteobacteria bacterium]
MAAIADTDSIETPYGWAVVVASLLFCAVAFGASYLTIVALKPVAAEFGWPRWVPSLAYSAILLGSGIGGVAMGHWADRSGVQWPARFGAVMIGLGLWVVSAAESAVVLVGACGLLIGLLGMSSAFAPLLTNVTRWFDRRRGMAVAIVASGQSVAGAVWPTTFNWGIETWGWRDTFLAYGIFCTLSMLPLSFVLARAAPQAAAQTKPMSPGVTNIVPAHVDFAPTAKLAMLCFAIVGCCIAMAMPMVHVVALCSDLGYGSDRGAEMLSLLLAAAFISRIGFGVLSDRIGGLMTILIGSALQAATMTFYAVVDSLFGLYVLSGIFGLVFGGIVPAYALAVRELFPESQAGWRMGVVFLFGTGGMAIGGVMGGWIFDLTDAYPLAFLAGVVFNIINLATISTLLWRARLATPVAA